MGDLRKRHLMAAWRAVDRPIVGGSLEAGNKNDRSRLVNFSSGSV